MPIDYNYVSDEGLVDLYNAGLFNKGQHTDLHLPHIYILSDTDEEHHLYNIRTLTCVVSKKGDKYIRHLSELFKLTNVIHPSLTPYSWRSLQQDEIACFVKAGDSVAASHVYILDLVTNPSQKVPLDKIYKDVTDALSSAIALNGVVEEGLLEHIYDLRKGYCGFED